MPAVHMTTEWHHSHDMTRIWGGGQKLAVEQNITDITEAPFHMPRTRPGTGLHGQGQERRHREYRDEDFQKCFDRIPFICSITMQTNKARRQETEVCPQIGTADL